MYHIVVVAVFDNNERETSGFDTYTDAAQWITDLANEREDVPLAIRMLREDD